MQRSKDSTNKEPRETSFSFRSLYHSTVGIADLLNESGPKEASCRNGISVSTFQVKQGHMRWIRIKLTWLNIRSKIIIT